MQYSIELEKTSLNNLISKLKASARREVIEETLLDSGIYLTRWIVRNRLLGPRPRYLGRVTGNLGGKITATPPEKTSDGYQIKIGTNVEYARIHEYGGTIKPGIKGFLAWRDRRTKGWIFTKKPVKIRARPFLRPALESQTNQLFVLNTLSKKINEAFNK